MSDSDKRKRLIIGIGNSGRQDDGLGWSFLDHVEKNFRQFDIEYRYQLQIEDAELISQYDEVVFVDAAIDASDNGYYFKPCAPSEKYSFSTHALKPETILHLAQSLYHKEPKSYKFGIEGYEWELNIGLTEKAKTNLEKAKEYFNQIVLNNFIKYTTN